ncbi:MAG TPA: ABC transporter ATPase, partial [Bacteroidia bacterium]|nr:ABC transporter ATPase [Bacteroidia bacterium]
MNTFSPQSKVWVYQSDRFFTEAEVADLTDALQRFASQWTAHSHQLQAAGEVRYNRFIVLMVDETQASASGCSIDSSVHFLKGIEKHTGVSLFDRQQIAYRKGNEIKTVPMQELAAALESGELTPETIVFNNTVTTKAQLEANWEMPLQATWMNR